MAQESCLDCFRKHIATAMVFEDEAEIGNGYPMHKWLAVGELNAAAKEVSKDYPVLANITRQHTLAYQYYGNRFPTVEILELSTNIEKDEENTEEFHI